MRAKRFRAAKRRFFSAIIAIINPVKKSLNSLIVSTNAIGSGAVEQSIVGAESLSETFFDDFSFPDLPLFTDVSESRADFLCFDELTADFCILSLPPKKNKSMWISINNVNNQDSFEKNAAIAHKTAAINAPMFFQLKDTNTLKPKRIFQRAKSHVQQQMRQYLPLLDVLMQSKKQRTLLKYMLPSFEEEQKTRLSLWNEERHYTDEMQMDSSHLKRSYCSTYKRGLSKADKSFVLFLHNL